MRYMLTYDLMEAAPQHQPVVGCNGAGRMASYPIFSMVPNPALNWMAAWGEVTERTFARMMVKPDWGIRTFTCEDGKDHLVEVQTVVERPFGDLIHFKVLGREAQPSGGSCWWRRCRATTPRCCAAR
jgi:poly(3-hydroxybutyrate) depolymerase